MKYYKFGRKRKPFYYVYDLKSRRKSDYMINTGRSKHVDGIYFENQTWGALHKAWKDTLLPKIKTNMIKWCIMQKQSKHFKMT